MNNKAKEVETVKIIRFQQELHSSNSNSFKKAIYRLTNIKPEQELEFLKQQKENKKKIETELSKKCSASKFQALTKMHSHLPDIFVVDIEIKSN